MVRSPTIDWQPAFIGLGQAAREARRQVEALLKQAAVTAASYEILDSLVRYPDGLGQTELQRELSMSKGTLSEHLGTLEKRGLVRRSVPADKRLRLVKITAAGRRRYEEARAILQSHEDVRRGTMRAVR